MLKQYLQIDDDEILRDTYERFTRYLAYPPTLPMGSLERIKSDLANEDPNVAKVAIADVAAPQFADELQAHTTSPASCRLSASDKAGVAATAACSRISARAPVRRGSSKSLAARPL